ncbi:MAG: TIGR03936 family radical SAM-associated protein [Clostridiales bacterium]|nr:TIGR03936 family radical SAM-associated protein [Clostridiales bacterium]
MLICKYTRRENAAFVPHLDTLRAVTMAVRRIGANAAYSEGFNPHMKIFFGQPLPIGTESDCEYFCLFATDEPQDFMRRMNASLPRGLRITAVAQVEKDPNVAKIMCFADYTVTMRDITPNLQAVNEFAAQSECVISFVQKGETKQKDVKAQIESLQAIDERTLRLRLCCGNVNLRADRLMAHLQKQYGLGKYDIVKTHMYDCAGTDLDTILFGGVM